MNTYKSKLKNLADKLKRDDFKVPVQEVYAIKESSHDYKNEAQLNVWIPKELLKKIKIYALEMDLSQKDITILALKAFIKT
jgi:predicted S18 family serine protease